MEQLSEDKPYRKCSTFEGSLREMNYFFPVAQLYNPIDREVRDLPRFFYQGFGGTVALIYCQ